MQDFGGFAAAVIGQAAGDFFALGIEDGDEFAAVEMAVRADAADGQQAGVLFGQGFCRAAIDGQAASGLDVSEQPLFAGGDAAVRAGKERAYAFALFEADEDVGFAAPCDDGGGSAECGAFGGGHFGVHAACTDAAACAARHAFEVGMVGRYGRNQFGLRIFARVAVVQAFLVGQKDKGVGFDEVGHERAEGVVVAEFDFVGGNGVVFVDDGDDAFGQQGLQGAAGVEVAGAVAQVVVGEQDLGGADAVRCERGFVGLGDAGLPDGGGGLQFVDGGGAFAPAQPFDAFGDGTAGNEDGLHALFAQFGDLRRPAVECGLVYAFAARGNKAGTDFDDKGADVGKVLQGHGFSRGGYRATSDGFLNVKKSSESAKTDFQTTPMGLSIRGIVKLLKDRRDSVSRLLMLTRYKKVV